MHIVEKKGTLLAMKLEDGDFAPGLCFFTAENDFIQVGSWRYPAGKSLAAHNHNRVQRSLDRTQEAVVVIRGRVRAEVFDEEDVFAGYLEAGAGEMLVLFHGGHGYHILEDDTLAIEVKNGPYPGADADRRRLA